MSSVGQTAFEYAYQNTPIILQNGIATAVGGYLPIIAVTEILDIPGWTGGQFFAQYRPLPGGTLEEWQVAEYPFASFQTAANAVVQQPLRVSMQMICPAQNAGGYILKQAILSALKYVLDQHILSGGSFTVVTPAFTYTNCLLTSIRDISSPSEKQVQYMFQWDFVQPLITASGAQSAFANFLDNVGGQLPSNFAWTDPYMASPSYNPASGWSI
jgi:hypothetical protein